MAPTVHVIPEPHIERWLLLDGAAFKQVFGVGCGIPDMKCIRSRYKELLDGAIREADISADLGGIEYAERLVEAMDLTRVRQSDRSFNRFVSDMEAAFNRWEG